MSVGNNLRGLYDPGGPYWYTGGVHIAAMLALFAGIAPCVPGFLATIGATSQSAFWTELYNYAWFISFGISFFVYLAITQVSQSFQNTLTTATR